MFPSAALHTHSIIMHDDQGLGNHYASAAGMLGPMCDRDHYGYT